AEVEWKRTLPIQNSVVNTSSTSVDLGKVPISSERNIIVQKLKTVIPRFKQEQKSIVEVIDGIREICRSKNSEEYGINIIYKSFNELKVTQDNTDTDVDEFATSVVDDAGDSMGKTYDFDFENMPIGEIIRYICLSSGVKYKIEEHAVVIADPRVAIDEVVTRFYPVSSNVFASIAETGATGGDDDLGGLDEGDSEAVSVKNYLEGTGVKFAAGAKVKYLEGISRLIFTNNITEHRRLQKILDQLQVDAAQIIVEAKFVEVQQANLDELGFQWTLEGHSSLAELGERRVGFRSVESADEIDAPLLAANQDPTAFRAGQGVRSLNKLAIDAPEDGLLAFNTVIDSFKFKTIMRALAQQENTDVLSAPKVLSENGSTAILRVVEERYFPESWEKPEIKVRGTTINTTTSPAGNLTTTRQRLEIQPSVPELGDARDIGVILEVTPTVDADGITIDLELKPEVVEFIRYDDAYNNEIIIFPRGDEVLFDTPILPALTQIAVLREAADLITWVGEESNVTAFFAGVADTVLFYQEEPELRIESRYDMPVISTRSVETRVKIWDGESVVIGGLMKEQVVTVNDRIPYLADLPLIGGLFENKGERREKNSLMIFVTARLIDRAGLPLRANDVRGLPDFKRL
ncbi:MAG: hypothetical protein HRT88_12095, partial [Lentisphaeraceae bacterium]|nr:hypothetical protein [Lentisphaeraceae bacterium]